MQILSNHGDALTSVSDAVATTPNANPHFQPIQPYGLNLRPPKIRLNKDNSFGNPKLASALWLIWAYQVIQFRACCYLLLSHNSQTASIVSFFLLLSVLMLLFIGMWIYNEFSLLSPSQISTLRLLRLKASPLQQSSQNNVG